MKEIVKTFLKNPYHFNFLWMTLLIILFCFMIFSSFLCSNYGLCFSKNSENISLGILSSLILLLLVEIVNFIYDQRKFNIIERKYRRTMITQLNENGVRSSEIPLDVTDKDIPENITDKSERIKILKEKKQNEREKLNTNKGEKYLDDSCYHELLYYKCKEVEYIIELNYEFHGKYTGTVEYFEHYSFEGDWRAREIRKTKAFVTLNLNPANPMTGTGSYKYQGKNDYGEYQIQINDETRSEIIVSYRDTIPSGLAEGYEIWRKTD